MNEDVRSLTKQMLSPNAPEISFLAEAIQNGFDINSLSPDNLSLFHYACFHNQEDIALLCLEYGANVEYVRDSFLKTRNPLYFAAAHNMIKVVPILCKRAPQYMEMSNKKGQTPFTIASLSGHLEAMKILHANQANIFAKTEEDQDAMYYSCVGNYHDSFRWLIGNGFDINETKPLELAISRNLTQILQVYLENEGKLNLKNRGLFRDIRLNLLLNNGV